MVELHCTKMMADLASARVQIAQGVCQDSQALLLSMLSDPVLEQASTLTFVIVAKAKLLASEILQQRTFDLKSSDAFLHYINNSDQSSERDDTFRLTPLELAVDAVKIFQKLANHRNVKITPENGSSKYEMMHVYCNAVDFHMSRVSRGSPKSENVVAILENITMNMHVYIAN